MNMGVFFFIIGLGIFAGGMMHWSSSLDPKTTGRGMGLAVLGLGIVLTGFVLGV